jgi:glucokinase
MVYVGLDLGGTATRVVVRHGDLTVATATFTTSDFGTGSPTDRVQKLWAVVSNEIPTGRTVASIGIAASGPMDIRTGIIDNEDTLPWFSGFDIVTLMAQTSKVPVALENDAVAAALGEYHHGAGKDAERLLLVTLGTGVGVALLENGHPFRQADGQHPESGHIPVTGDEQICYCGLRGCWEQSASRLALERLLQPLHYEGAPSTSLVNDVAIQASRGDEKASEAFADYGRKVGRGIGLLHSVLGPSVTVIAGSVAEHFELFSQGMNDSLERSQGFRVSVPIVRAALGPEAGAIGAAALATTKFSGDTSTT